MGQPSSCRREKNVAKWKAGGTVADSDASAAAAAAPLATGIDTSKWLLA